MGEVEKKSVVGVWVSGRRKIGNRDEPGSFAVISLAWLLLVRRGRDGAKLPSKAH